MWNLNRVSLVDIRTSESLNKLIDAYLINFEIFVYKLNE